VTTATLFVSDLAEVGSNVVRKQLEVLGGSGMDSVTWKDAQKIKPSDYEVAILDTRIAARTPEQLRAYEFFFESMQPEISILLQAGGVVFVLAGPTIPVRAVRGDALETNYDFLPKFLLGVTQLSFSESREGSRYEKEKNWYPYFLTAPRYYKTVPVKTDEKGVYIWYYANGKGITEKVRPLAVTTVTSQVVGCLISWQHGVVGVLPPPDDMMSALLFLQNKGAELYKENVENLGVNVEPPGWIHNYRSSEHRRLEQETSTLEGELANVRQKLKPFQLVSTSLYSIGKGLEVAVTRIFLDFDWSVDDLTKKDQPIDYVIKRRDETSKSLVVALTGTTGYLDSKSGKLAQLLGALPEVGDNGRLVFLVNGSVEIDPAIRATSNYLTEEALKRLAKNDICVLVVYDLYRLWLDYLAKKTTTDQIFESIHKTCGLFNYVPP